MTPSTPNRRSPALVAVAWLKKLALPPGGPLAVALPALALPDPWRLPAVAASLVLLWITATPWFGLLLLRRLEIHGPFDIEGFAPRPGRDAIVVLDAGRYLRSAGGESVKPETLERLRYAASLHRRTGLPILASGDGAGPLMGTVLAEDFGVETRWLEVASRTTQENADLSAERLAAAGVDRVLLVTHAWHMPRAVRAFRRTGLEVTPAPLGFAGPDRQEVSLLMAMPSAGGLQSTSRALHELIGLRWYALRFDRRR
ncbi:MAG: YdcF family protein [Acidobacteriota bacterium]